MYIQCWISVITVPDSPILVCSPWWGNPTESWLCYCLRFYVQFPIMCVKGLSLCFTDIFVGNSNCLVMLLSICYCILHLLCCPLHRTVSKAFLHNLHLKFYMMNMPVLELWSVLPVIPAFSNRWDLSVSDTSAICRVSVKVRPFYSRIPHKTVGNNKAMDGLALYGAWSFSTVCKKNIINCDSSGMNARLSRINISENAWSAWSDCFIRAVVEILITARINKNFILYLRSVLLNQNKIIKENERNWRIIKIKNEERTKRNISILIQILISTILIQINSKRK